MNKTLDDKVRAADGLNLVVSVDEINMILEGLGVLPYARVYRLVDKLQAQARRQLETNPAERVNGE